MAPSYLAEIESCRKTGSIDVLKRLARVLDVTLDDLVPPDAGAAERRDSAAAHEPT